MHVLSYCELLNLTQLTEDIVVKIVDNIEQGHDIRIVDGVTNDSDMLDSQLLNLSRITYDMLINEDINTPSMDSNNNISPWIVIITSRHG